MRVGVVQTLLALPPPAASGVVSGDSCAGKCLLLDLVPSGAPLSNNGFVAYPLLEAPGASKQDALEPATQISHCMLWAKRKAACMESRMTVK